VDAVSGAITRVEWAAPNARDYYPLPGGFTKAMRQHEGRLQALRLVLDDLQEIVTHAQDAIDQRNERQLSALADAFDAFDGGDHGDGQ
jgi:hypothetical protein